MLRLIFCSYVLGAKGVIRAGTKTQTTFVAVTPDCMQVTGCTHPASMDLYQCRADLASSSGRER